MICLNSQGRGNFKKRPSRVSTIMHHAYLNVIDFVCNIDEKCQVFFSIYDARGGRFIRFVDPENKFIFCPGMPVNGQCPVGIGY